MTPYAELAALIDSLRVRTVVPASARPSEPTVTGARRARGRGRSGAPARAHRSAYIADAEIRIRLVAAIAPDYVRRRGAAS